MKIKKNDQVKIIAGKDKGKTGKILRVIPSEGKVFIEGLNLVKRHRKPRKEGEKGQRLETPGKLNVSNLMLVCPKCGKPTRLGSKKVADKKVRVCKKCNAEI
jgi:large subunit ribosomal protein L24